MKMDIAVTVNGRKYQASVEPRMLLSDFLRDTIGLTGTLTLDAQGDPNAAGPDGLPAWPRFAPGSMIRRFATLGLWITIDA